MQRKVSQKGKRHESQSLCRQDKILVSETPKYLSLGMRGRKNHGSNITRRAGQCPFSRTPRSRDLSCKEFLYNCRRVTPGHPPPYHQPNHNPHPVSRQTECRLFAFPRIKNSHTFIPNHPSESPFLNVWQRGNEPVCARVIVGNQFPVRNPLRSKKKPRHHA